MRYSLTKEENPLTDVHHQRREAIKVMPTSDAIIPGRSCGLKSDEEGEKCCYLLLG